MNIFHPLLTDLRAFNVPQKKFSNTLQKKKSNQKRKTVFFFSVVGYQNLVLDAVICFSVAFGRSSVTPTICEIMHTGAFYILQASFLGKSVGIPGLALVHFSEEMGETHHVPDKRAAHHVTNFHQKDIKTQMLFHEKILFVLRETVGSHPETGKFAPL
jgi:hypothetical protein